ncbi:MAG: GntR family transcriptional regulator [Ruminococcaceae bacterium]|nr:GntR family transcriptional regulator [Oscillospiraceae bacterium]
MSWQFHNKAPVYLQLVSRIRKDILNGRYKADEQVPPVRQMAFEAAVNPNTMQKAFAELEREGLLYVRSTAGRFVTSDEEILRRARKTMQEEALSQLLEEALSLGISKDDIINFVQQSKNA